jgi:hypothetical protein
MGSGTPVENQRWRRFDATCFGLISGLNVLKDCNSVTLIQPAMGDGLLITGDWNKGGGGVSDVMSELQADAAW